MSLVEMSKRNHIALLTINRPEALNSLNEEVLDALSDAVDSIDDDVRCVIITGAGSKAFVAGADVAVLATQDAAEARRFGEKGAGVFRRIESLRVPVIAAVNGYALGGGFELALACDIRIASSNAVFALPEVTLGITPGFGGTQRIVRVLGMGVGKELLYTARRMKADEALRVGAVNAVYSPEALMDEAFALAERIASNAPIAVRAAKRAVNEGFMSGIDADLAVELDAYTSCYGTRDQANAMAAFVNKQKPPVFENK